MQPERKKSSSLGTFNGRILYLRVTACISEANSPRIATLPTSLIRYRRKISSPGINSKSSKPHRLWLPISFTPTEEKKEYHHLSYRPCPRDQCRSNDSCIQGPKVCPFSTAAGGHLLFNIIRQINLGGKRKSQPRCATFVTSDLDNASVQMSQLPAGILRRMKFFAWLDQQRRAVVLSC
jgi:hypothetical protein